jgi:hypothetical protein
VVFSPDPHGTGKKQTDYSRPWSVEARVVFVVIALPVLAVLVAAAASSPSGDGIVFDTIIVGFVSIFAFGEGLVGSCALGFDALAPGLAALAAQPLAGALLFGVLAGVAVALVQRLWLPAPAPVKKSLAATLASKEFWMSSGVDSVRLIATNLAVAYGVIAVMSMLGVFAAPEGFTAAVHHIATVGGGFGGDIYTCAELLRALMATLGVLVGLGLLSGLSLGAVTGAVFGALGWTGLAVPTLKGAAKGATVAVFEHDDTSLIRRAATGALFGALNGAVGGMLIAVALGLMQVCGVPLG